MSVERLHIDELKRVEKQTATLLKAWQRLQKDQVDLQEKYRQLEAKFTATGEQYLLQLQEKEDSHQQTLREVEEQWQQRYEDEMTQLRQKLTDTQQQHQRELEEVRSEFQARFDTLHNELKQERATKAIMVARIRGVDHE